jgi:alanine-alpha-ketoisovalerate/valine-pyruvate aminotransferase
MDISRQEAYEKGLKLLRLMEIVYQPMTQEEYAAVQAHMRETAPQLLTRLHKHEPRIFNQRPSGESKGENRSA